MTQRRHLARDRVHLLERRAQQPQALKPIGLWYEVDRDWQRWCSIEHFRLGPFWGYELELDLDKILVLRTPQDLDRFTDEFGSDGSLGVGVTYIAWARVAERWGGIEIAPYQWERRLAFGMLWYYGWDCASGCIWEPTVITRWEFCGMVTVSAADVPTELASP